MESQIACDIFANQTPEDREFMRLPVYHFTFRVFSPIVASFGIFFNGLSLIAAKRLGKHDHVYWFQIVTMANDLLYCIFNLAIYLPLRAGTMLSSNIGPTWAQSSYFLVFIKTHVHINYFGEYNSRVYVVNWKS